jgi:hypothetical protein
MGFSDLEKEAPLPESGLALKIISEYVHVGE